MPKLNRIREVRLRHQLQVRALARHLGVNVIEAREIEHPENDVPASVLIKTAQWLQVPVGELLAEDESDELHRLRGFVLRAAKSCNTMIDLLSPGAAKNLALTLRRQAIEMIPEAEGLGNLHFAARRPPTEPSPICDHPVPEEFLMGDPSGKLLQND